MQRIGLGQDAHLYAGGESKPLVLGGVQIKENGGLAGNSDADVVLHSLCNALSSAIGGDSLGTWADDLCFKHGITDSQVYVARIMDEVVKAGYRIANISISVECKRPWVSLDVIAQMKEVIARLLCVQFNQVGITFTSSNGMSVFGKGKGVSGICMVLLESIDDR